MRRFFDSKKEIDFTKYFNLSLWIAFLIPLCAILGLFTVGLNWGIDFAGGTELQVLFDRNVSAEEIRRALEESGFSKHQVQNYGPAESNEKLIRVERTPLLNAEKISNLKKSIATDWPSCEIYWDENLEDTLEIRLPLPSPLAAQHDPQALTQALDSQKHRLLAMLQQHHIPLRKTKALPTQDVATQEAIFAEPTGEFVHYRVQLIGVGEKIAAALFARFGKVDIRRAEFVDSQVSQQLRTDGALAALYALIAILIYICLRFSFLYSPGAIIALLQDTFGALLVFILARIEFDLPSVAALLTILGVSINNTIVVYDRIREKIPADKTLSADKIKELVNQACNDTLGRNINTTLTILLAIGSLWFFSAGALKNFALVLTVGIALGALSATLASPAAFLFMYKKFAHPKKSDLTSKNGFTREEKARGVV